VRYQYYQFRIKILEKQHASVYKNLINFDKTASLCLNDINLDKNLQCIIREYMTTNFDALGQFHKENILIQVKRQHYGYIPDPKYD
jgi:hypothetical protein